VAERFDPGRAQVKTMRVLQVAKLGVIQVSSDVQDIGQPA
jgi:hypothetical protein